MNCSLVELQLISRRFIFKRSRYQRYTSTTSRICWWQAKMLHLVVWPIQPGIQLLLKFCCRFKTAVIDCQDIYTSPKREDTTTNLTTGVFFLLPNLTLPTRACQILMKNEKWMVFISTAQESISFCSQISELSLFFWFDNCKLPKFAFEIYKGIH